VHKNILRMKLARQLSVLSPRQTILVRRCTRTFCPVTDVAPRHAVVGVSLVILSANRVVFRGAKTLLFAFASSPGCHTLTLGLTLIAVRDTIFPANRPPFFSTGATFFGALSVGPRFDALTPGCALVAVGVAVLTADRCVVERAQTTFFGALSVSPRVDALAAG